MPDNNKIITFRLEGPLQSWGERSKWDLRDSGAFPSKSGVTGLISCALGLEREDPEICKICDSVEMAVRADRAGSIMTDYHTVMSEKLLNAKGEKRANGNTIVTKRQYLQDASFLVALKGPTKLIDRIKKALDAPARQIFLGRKSCVPSVPVIGTVYEETDLPEVLNRIELPARHDAKIICEFESPDGSGQLRNDVFDGNIKRFKSRRVVRKALEV